MSEVRLRLSKEQRKRIGDEVQWWVRTWMGFPDQPDSSISGVLDELEEKVEGMRDDKRRAEVMEAINDAREQVSALEDFRAAFWECGTTVEALLDVLGERRPKNWPL